MFKRSVSIVLKFQDQLLMSRRRNDLQAFPGYDAFVGGRVEKKDSFSHKKYDLGHEVFGAAIRELNEELNIDLVDLIENGTVLNIKDLGIFQTPPSFPIRFSNTTLLVELNKEINFKYDENELEFAKWYPIKDLYQLYIKGELLIVPAVKAVFWALYHDLNPKEELEKLFEKSKKSLYVIDALNEFHILPIPSLTLPPAKHTNAFLIGDTLIDPSPKDEETFYDVLSFIKSYKIKKIFLTHHHPDHRQYSSDIARHLKVPMFMSKFSYQEILKEEGDIFFKNIEVKYVQEGDKLTQWLGNDVIAYEVPGHDEGQLALMPLNKRWMIVGDLIQGVGTVVIAQPEGDMKKYFESLQKCIDLNPEIIIPSHGGALGSTFYLKKALNHRKLRENQIIQAKNEGKNLAEMLDIIYPNLKEELRPLAMENIKSHLKKISENNY